MIINDKHKFVFIHVPKTAGSSLIWGMRHILRPVTINQHVDDKVNISWQEDFHTDKKRHSTYSDFINKYPNKQDYFKFGFVRNPWDWWASWYYFRVKMSQGSVKLSFSEFLRKPRTKEDSFEMRDQYSYLYDKDSGVDYVAQYENYENEINFLNFRLNIDIKLFNKNVSRSDRDYTKLYTSQEDIDFVKQNFWRDVLTFGYEFGK